MTRSLVHTATSAPSSLPPPLLSASGYAYVQGFSWLQDHANKKRFTFIKLNGPVTSESPMDNDQLRLCLCHLLERRYGGTVVKARTKSILAGWQSHQAFRCANRDASSKFPIPYAQMMRQEDEDRVLQAIRAGGDPCVIGTSLEFVKPEYRAFFNHLFGCEANSHECIPCQILVEDWRALKLAREQHALYSYISIGTRLTLD